MAVGLPAKTTYVDGDVFSASDINDTNGTLNLVGQTTNFYAAKNRIINGDFRFNQRNFTSNTAANTYGFDRWKQFSVGGSFTTSPQTFTPGAAPVAGYEATNFLRGITATQSAAGDYATFDQPIEDVRTFANQTVTISFWAKAASGTPKVSAEFFQNFGSGGSSSVSTPAGSVTISTAWARYSLTILAPSISGKTIGTGSCVEIFLWVSAGATFAARASSIGIQNNTFDIWGVQVEAGSTATAFQTATGTIQGELAACQRYYYRFTSQSSYSQFGIGQATGSTSGFVSVRFPVSMRIRPTALEQSGTASNYGVTRNNGGVESLTSVPNYDGVTTSEVAGVGFTTAGNMTAGNASYMLANNNTTAFLGWSAEL